MASTLWAFSGHAVVPRLFRGRNHFWPRLVRWIQVITSEPDRSFDTSFFSRRYGAPLIPEYWRPVAAFFGMARGALAAALPQGWTQGTRPHSSSATILSVISSRRGRRPLLQLPTRHGKPLRTLPLRGRCGGSPQKG